MTAIASINANRGRIINHENSRIVGVGVDEGFVFWTEKVTVERVCILSCVFA